MKRILFFALRTDLLTLLELVESTGPLQYARMGNFAHADYHDNGNRFYHAAELPNLGKASAESSIAGEAFLICDRETVIQPRHLQGASGERTCVDQFANPDSVVFQPGGVWNEDVVLYGTIATASGSQVSQTLMKRFQSATKRTFSKVKAYYVGPAAHALLHSGKRLTISAQTPREFDLIAPSV